MSGLNTNGDARRTRGSGWASLDDAAACPFYRSNNDQHKTITCEGPWFNTSTRVTFKRRREYEKRLRVCCDIRPDCPVWRAAMEKYGEDPNDG